MLRTIVQTGHPVLRQTAEPVDLAWIGTDEFNALVDDMVETMREAPGVGLAAPQIGLPLQLVVIEDRSAVVDSLDEDVVASRERIAVPLTVLVNPALKPIGREKVTFYEGCLSVDGFAAETSRHRRVKVKALDRKGLPLELEWQGWPARILQHEIDHLVGVLYLDRMESRSFATVDNLQRSFDDPNGDLNDPRAADADRASSNGEDDR